MGENGFDTIEYEKYYKSQNIFKKERIFHISPVRTINSILTKYNNKNTNLRKEKLTRIKCTKISIFKG